MRNREQMLNRVANAVGSRMHDLGIVKRDDCVWVESRIAKVLESKGDWLRVVFNDGEEKILRNSGVKKASSLEEQLFQKESAWWENRKFKHPETGHMVKFKSLPLPTQKELNDQMKQQMFPEEDEPQAPAQQPQAPQTAPEEDDEPQAPAQPAQYETRHPDVLPPRFIVNYIESNPNDPKNNGYQEVWDDVVDKLKGAGKMNYGAGVAYWRNKAKKVLGSIPEQLDKKPGPMTAPTAPRPKDTLTPTKKPRTVKPKAPAPAKDDWKEIPQPDEQIEDWTKQNATSKSLINKYVKQRSELESQLADIQTKLKALKPLEEKLMPIVKAMKEGSVSVGDSILKYKNSKRTTVKYEKAFQMALSKVEEAQREFTKGWILGQLTSENVTEKLELTPKGGSVKALYDKTAGVWNYINDQTEKLKDLASNYMRAVVQLDKVVS